MSTDERPDWDHWRAVPALAAWEAVALSLGRDPKAVRRKIRRRYDPLREAKLPVAISYKGESPEFRKRLSIIERAVISDAGGINTHIRQGIPSEWVITPASVRAFLRGQGIGYPVEWDGEGAATSDRASPSTVETEEQSESRDTEGWKATARQRGRDLAQKHPRWGVEQIAQEIEEGFRKDGITGRGGKVVSWLTIKRHALSGIRS